MEAWAATSSWRGDLKFFGRVIQRARDEARRLKCPDTCCIEFAVGDEDLERYESVEDMLALAPASTLRSFSSARVQIGSKSLCIKMRFGRGQKLPLGLDAFIRPKAAFSCPSGITIEVTSDGAVGQGDLESVRNAVAAVVARGGFFWARPPTSGPLSGGPGLDEVRAKRWGMRKASAQVVFLFIAVGLLLVLAVVGHFAGSKNETDSFSRTLSEPAFLIGVVTVAQLVSFPLSTLIFPAIDIADTTPGRRMIQVIGRSGILTTAVGLAAKGLLSA